MPISRQGLVLSSVCIGLALWQMTTTAATDSLPPQLHYDHANPYVLNEFALQKVKAGDIGTAVILLERAVSIAPYDARIRRNLDVVHTLQSGKAATQPLQSVRQEPGIAPESGAANVETGLPAIPLWKLK
ncbi:MAG: tetratricopeptide repeat protein [Burkholderiales bacterium]